VAANTAALSVLIFIRILMSSWPSLVKFDHNRLPILLDSLGPYGLEIVALRRELPDAGAVRQHRINLRGASTHGREHQMDSVWRPPWILVPSAIARQLDRNLVRNVHHENIQAPGLVPARPAECDM